MTPEEQKEAVKEALQEWLDKQFTLFGRWSLRSIGAVLLATLVYMWAASHGWTLK